MFKLPAQSRVYVRFRGIPASCVPRGKLTVTRESSASPPNDLDAGQIASGIEITPALGARGVITVQIDLGKEPEAAWNLVLELRVKKSDGKSDSYPTESGAEKDRIQMVNVAYEVSNS